VPRRPVMIWVLSLLTGMKDLALPVSPVRSAFGGALVGIRCDRPGQGRWE
jgi:hypothetical protein